MRLLGTKNPPVMGLDIGSSSIRLLQLSRHGSSYRIDHFAIEPLPPGVIVEKSVQDIEAISEAIRAAVRNSGSNSKYCAVAVSGSAVFTKTISLPANLADADIESQVQIEANQYIPYPLDEISLDFEVLGPSPRNADMVDILLAASKNENVESRQDALESLGLRARVVDVESFAIANAFELIDDARRRACIADDRRKLGVAWSSAVFDRVDATAPLLGGGTVVLPAGGRVRYGSGSAAGWVRPTRRR